MITQKEIYTTKKAFSFIFSMDNNYSIDQINILSIKKLTMHAFHL